MDTVLWVKNHFNFDNNNNKSNNNKNINGWNSTFEDFDMLDRIVYGISFQGLRRLLLFRRGSISRKFINLCSECCVYVSCS